VARCVAPPFETLNAHAAHALMPLLFLSENPLILFLKRPDARSLQQ